LEKNTDCKRSDVQIDSVSELRSVEKPEADFFLCVQTNYRAFPVAGARIWNDLPADVTSAPSLLTFRKRFKLHLFRRSYL